MTTPADEGIRAARNDARKANAAAQDYRLAFLKVQALMADVGEHIAEHSKKQEADPRNWGYVGDMQHYAELLESLLGRESKLYNIPDGKGGFVRVSIPK